MVTMPTRGSFNSRAINSVRSRWIWSATLKARLGVAVLFAGMSKYSLRHEIGLPAGRPPQQYISYGEAAQQAGTDIVALQRAGDFLHFEELQLVAFLDVVVVA